MSRLLLMLLFSGCVSTRAREAELIDALFAAAPEDGDGWRDPAHGFRCTAVKVLDVQSEELVMGYQFPVRCVDILEKLPGSRRIDGGYVIGCQRPKPAAPQACFDAAGELSVRP